MWNASHSDGYRDAAASCRVHVAKATGIRRPRRRWFSPPTIVARRPPNAGHCAFFFFFTIIYHDGGLDSCILTVVLKVTDLRQPRICIYNILYARYTFISTTTLVSCKWVQWCNCEGQVGTCLLAPKL